MKNGLYYHLKRGSMTNTYPSCFRIADETILQLVECNNIHTLHLMKKSNNMEHY